MARPRHGFVLRVRPERLEEYKRYHRAVWPEVLNAIVRGFKGRAVREHLESVFHERVNVLSRDDATAVARVLAGRYAESFRLLGMDVHEFVAARDPWRVLCNLRGALEGILSAADRW